jgi:hypothetical protein
MTQQIYGSYAEFWPDYLRAHSKPKTRAIHYAGTAIAGLLVAAFVLTADSRFLLPALVTPYAFAWSAHLLVEHNQPASFKHPLWSVLSGARMFALWLAGKLRPELLSAGIPDDQAV